MEVPPDLKPYLTTEVDMWENPHYVCRKCRKKFFTLRDAALHLYHVHNVRVAQRHINPSSPETSRGREEA